MLGIIYCAENKKNHKKYIGQTKQTLIKRITQHKHDSSRRNYIFAKAIQKYGVDGFSWTVLYETDDEEDLDIKEIYFIELYDTCNKKIGYNLQKGGHTPRMLQETKDKISRANKGRKHTEEEKIKISKSKKGRKRISRKGKLTEKELEHLKNIRGHSGWHHSAETKIASSIRMKGKYAGKLNYFYGIHKYGRDNHNSKKIKCIETGEIFDSGMDIKRKYGFNNGHISSCCNGKREQAYGFHWEFLPDILVN